MCDYSLVSEQSRLAVEGEKLVVHSFPSGSKGLATPADVQALETWRSQNSRSRIVRLFGYGQQESKVQPRVCAVCVPPGARLRINAGDHAGDVVTFDQLSEKVFFHRDAIRFADGKSILINRLERGTEFQVVSLSGALEREPVREGFSVAG